MPKLYSSRHISLTLEKNGFIFVSQKGSHAKFRRKTITTILTTIVPMGKREIPIGTFKAILRQSQLKNTHFELK